MLDWVRRDMQEDPQQIIDRLSTLLHGNIAQALSRLPAGSPIKRPEK